jgi:DNA-binding NarL/FixJ family response regulator
MFNQASIVRRVLVHHCSPLLAAGLRVAMLNQPGWRLLPELTDPLNVLIEERCREPEREDDVPDVVLTDYECGMQYWLARRERLLSPCSRSGPRIVLVTNVHLEYQVREAIASGIEGYLGETTSIQELVTVVREVSQGRRYVSGNVAHLLAAGLAQPDLSLREIEVLRLISLGRPNKIIARELAIAAGTVKSHVRSILAKLEVATRTEAAHVAQSRGLVSHQSGVGARASASAGGAGHFPAFSIGALTAQ